MNYYLMSVRQPHVCIPRRYKFSTNGIDLPHLNTLRSWGAVIRKGRGDKVSITEVSSQIYEDFDAQWIRPFQKTIKSKNA